METIEDPRIDVRDAPTPTRRRRPRLLLEIAIILGFYVIYTGVRNQFGSALGESARRTALANARFVIDLERAVGLYVEERLQELFIDQSWFIRFWNIFYGSFHFVVTIGVLLVLWAHHGDRYLRWRAVLLSTTGLALIGFAAFPLMPPRLLSDFGTYGGRDPRFDYVDTLVDPGGFWSFDSGTMQEISNQYAAMPSLHVAWAVWCTLAIYPVLRRRWTRVTMFSYPVLTLFAVMITANHYWIDAVGGLIALAGGIMVAPYLARLLPKLPRTRPAATT